MSSVEQQQPLSEILPKLKAQVESLVASQDGELLLEKDQLEKIYRNELTPNLLKLRCRQRLDMDQLEDRDKKLKELNQELLNLQDQCDCVIYEASCLFSEVDEVKQEASKSESPIKMKNGCDSFDLEALGKLDFETRMRMLDEEEAQRKSLADKVNALSEETTRIAQLNTESAAQINEVKPHIRQLLDKVTPILMNSKNDST